jgi:hypothetical protein
MALLAGRRTAAKVLGCYVGQGNFWRKVATACVIQPFWYFSGVTRSALAQDTTVARTIRFPASLRERITSDAERCGRSFEGQVLALLRRHYGEDVDIAPSPNDILALAAASLSDVPAADARALVRRLKEAER